MKVIAEDARYKYSLLEDPREVSLFKIPDFDFFKVYGFVDYSEMFKVWLRKFPRPVFIVAVTEGTILGWIYMERSKIMSNEVIYVLRSIEVLKSYRKSKIGSKLVHLGAYLCPGVISTKPLTKDAEHFFKDVLGFMEPQDYRRMDNIATGYLVLPYYKRSALVKELSRLFTVIY